VLVRKREEGNSRGAGQVYIDFWEGGSLEVREEGNEGKKCGRSV
jgi:hypothetical protein